MTASSEAAVVLRGGLVASVAALQILWDLEARGFALALVGDGLRVLPVAALTPRDAAAIRGRRDELVALVRYCDGIQ